MQGGRRARRGALVLLIGSGLLASALATAPFGELAAADETTTTEPSTTTPSTTAPATSDVPTTTVPAPAAEPVPLTPTQLWAVFVAWYRASLPAPPAASGVGRRIVYSIGQQRVWLIGADGTTEHSYLVSGRRGLPSVGVHRVFSKSRYSSSGAVSMQYMVRFAHGRRLAIGFHSIPVRGNGTMIQTLAQLGTPRSHGCVRQRLDQARLLWNWTPVGTTVVVTA